MCVHACVRVGVRTLVSICLCVWQAVKASLIAKRPPNQTVMCITHELSTIRDADHILFFSRDKQVRCCVQPNERQLR